MKTPYVHKKTDSKERTPIRSQLEGDSSCSGSSSSASISSSSSSPNESYGLGPHNGVIFRMVLNMLDFEDLCFDMFRTVILEHQCSRAMTPWATRELPTLRAFEKPSRPRSRTIGPQGILQVGNPRWGCFWHDFTHA